MRYQNAIVLASVGGAIFIWASDRRKAVTVYLLGSAVPLSTSAAVNHFRLDSWNPISKGPGYLTVPLLENVRTTVFDPVVMFWAPLVDFSTRPELTAADVRTWLRYDATTGAHLVLA